jgi:hypothetical protein
MTNAADILIYYTICALHAFPLLQHLIIIKLMEKLISLLSELLPTIRLYLIVYSSLAYRSPLANKVMHGANVREHRRLPFTVTVSSLQSYFRPHRQWRGAEGHERRLAL